MSDPVDTRIDDLNVAVATRNHVLPAMAGGQSAQISVNDILALLSKEDIATLRIAAAAKVTVADADRLLLFDSAASNAPKLATLANIIASIFKTSRKIPNAYFDSSARFWDATDLTKGLQLVLSGIATATTRTLTMPNRNVDLGLVPSYAMFVGTPTALTLGGLITQAHGLGAKPDVSRCRAKLVCVTTDLNWLAGEEIQVNPDFIGTVAGYGVQVYADATNVYGRVGNTGIGAALNKTTGAASSLNPANWNLSLVVL